MKAPVSTVPKVVLPGDAGRWTRELDFESCEVASAPRTKESPPTVLLARSGDPLLRVTAEKLRDGLHFYVSPRPASKWAPLHLALRNKPFREAKMSATAAVLTGVALHCKEYRGGGGAHLDWMKKVHQQVLRQLEEHGLHGLSEVSPGFLTLVRECMRLVDRAMNKDVDDAVERLRSEFSFLMDHLSEEDVVQVWREVLVDKTHAR